MSSWGLWGLHTAADYRSRNDANYFPDYDVESEDVDEDDPTLTDLQNSWVIGKGMDRRKPHIQRGVEIGPSSVADIRHNHTEKFLQDMGHEFATRIHQSPPTEDHLFRGMTVPSDWVENAARTKSVTLPLSSFDYDSSTAADYSRPDPMRSSSTRTGHSVLMRLDPGAKAFPLLDTEHLTHGDFDVHDIHPITDEEAHEYGVAHDNPTVMMHLRQRSVPAPVGHHTASTDGIRYAHVVEADVADDLMKLAGVVSGPGDLHVPVEELWSYRQGEVDPGSPYDAKKLQDLEDGGVRDGIHTPVTVATDGAKAVISDGLHRAWWARQNGVSHVPVVVEPPSFDLSHEGGDVGPALASHLKNRHAARLAAVTQNLVNQLHNEFHQWWDESQKEGKRFVAPKARIVRRVPPRNARLAMAWDEWAPQIQHAYDADNPLYLSNGARTHRGRYHISHEDGSEIPDGHAPMESDLVYWHAPDHKKIKVEALATYPGFEGQGVAEALGRRLAQDYPDHTINPGGMTDDGRGFHDRMMEKNPDGWRMMASARIAAPRPQDPQLVVDRLRALNHRHFLHRTTRPLPDRVLSQHPPLSVQEEAERQKLNSMTTKLHDRWNEMTPLTDGEMALHQALHPMDHRKDDLDSMSDRQKAEHFADLHHLPEVAFGRMPREQHQYDRLKPWAEHYFGNMENDVQDEVERHRQYLQTGRHPSGVTSLEGLDDAHRPELTGAWASELAANGTGKRLRARQEEYHQALHRVATHGPLHRDQNQLADMYAFQHLDNARNNLRVELQHAYLFRVPHTDELSPIEEPSERHARSGLANPRYAHGTGGKTVAAQMAYQVNCQRCVLAAEARHRGHNVEARPNYRDATDSSGNDRQFQDHDIATWFRNADGTVPKWIDAEDQFDPDEYKPTDYGRPTMKHDELPDGGYGLRLKHQPGEKQWDHMHEQIKSWGPGARGAVVMSTPTLTGNSHTRHIIHVVVDDKGKVNYIDPQTGNNDASHHRESIGYNLHPENQTKRLWVDKRPIDEDDKVALHNQNMSPLRFMRLDDKQLAPGTAQHMVDRGTANGRGIIPPDTTTTS